MKIVIAGSCKHAPYDILIVPNPLNPLLYKQDHERAFTEACKVFHPKIDEADQVWVYAPNGTIGEHTQRDIDYAESKGKEVFIIIEKKAIEDIITVFQRFVGSLYKATNVTP